MPRNRDREEIHESRMDEYDPERIPVHSSGTTRFVTSYCFHYNAEDGRLRPRQSSPLQAAEQAPYFSKVILQALLLLASSHSGRPSKTRGRIQEHSVVRRIGREVTLYLSLLIRFDPDQGLFFNMDLYFWGLRQRKFHCYLGIGRRSNGKVIFPSTAALPVCRFISRSRQTGR
ncbi:hypothetical protein HD806DRAFT_103892 [Xylariaceae sp. AK1471]|nr:hypothetical protein HD806DRAFT_103892 [Xylariaceae sp. AK1471]